MCSLEVLIAAYGPEAPARIASLSHPRMEGVNYLIGWQRHEGAPIPEAIAERDDFRVFREESVGLCNNRNALLAHATAPIVLISDDDLAYTEQDLLNVIEAFRLNPDCDVLTFRFRSPHNRKPYPSSPFDLRHPPRGYYPTSMEIAIRLPSSLVPRPSSLFHPAFGVNGTHFGSGEEDLLIASLLRAGARGRFIPLDVCENTETTTGVRNATEPDFVSTKGAVMLYTHPATWPLRMLTHAWRARKDTNLLRYCQHWLRGVRTARKNRLFRNLPDPRQT